MADPARKRASYEDVLAAPPHLRAEVIDGELILHPRPRRRHIRSASSLGSFLHGAFDAGLLGPGGWVILDEPELHLGAEPDIVVPDLCGYREERYPGDRDDDEPYFVLAPDWVCEVLSTSTARLDRTKKMPIFARVGVPHVWIVDPRDRTVEVFRLGPDGYVLVQTWAGEEAPATLEPFAAVPIPVAAFWGRELSR